MHLNGREKASGKAYSNTLDIYWKNRSELKLASDFKLELVEKNYKKNLNSCQVKLQSIHMVKQFL